MGALTLTAGAIAALYGGAYYARYRFSRDWIDLRSKSEYDLTGKVIVITGGNVGLGFEAAKDFVRRGATVVIGCRDTTRGEEAAKSIMNDSGDTATAVECIQLDLASQDSVRAFALKVQEKYESIHALVLNAGVWVPMDQKKKTDSGYEIHFGVNHLGHFLLVQCLKAHLEKSDSRIVIVGSSLMKMGKLDLDKQDFVHEGRESEKKGFAPTGYCDSKLMNALMCRHMATTILKNTSVTTYTVCPGFCQSSLGRNVEYPTYQKLLIAPVFMMVQRTTVQGAQNIIFATVVEKEKLENGAVYSDGKVKEELSTCVQALGDDAPKRLWDLSENLLNDK